MVAVCLPHIPSVASARSQGSDDTSGAAAEGGAIALKPGYYSLWCGYIESRRSVGTPQRERLVFLCGRGFHSGCYLSVFHPRIIWLEEDAQATPVRRGETACYFMLPPPLPPPALYPPPASLPRESRVMQNAGFHHFKHFFSLHLQAPLMSVDTPLHECQGFRGTEADSGLVCLKSSLSAAVSPPPAPGGTLVAFPFTF